MCLSFDYQPPRLIPRYLSVSQPLSSTSIFLLWSPAHHIASSPPPPTTTSTRRPSGSHVNPEPIRGGLTWASEDSQLPFAPSAHRRMKLASGGASIAVGHSRQPGSGAWPALHPLSPPLSTHKLPPPNRIPSKPLGSLPIIPRTSPPSCLFAPCS